MPRGRDVQAAKRLPLPALVLVADEGGVLRLTAQDAAAYSLSQTRDASMPVAWRYGDAQTADFASGVPEKARDSRHDPLSASGTLARGPATD